MQADDMLVWYTDQTEESGSGLAGVMRRVGELYWHALNLGRFLGMDEQEVHDVARWSEDARYSSEPGLGE